MRKSDPKDINVDQLRELGYERTDVSLPKLVIAISFLFVFIAFSSIVSWFIYSYFVPEIGNEPPGQKTAFAKHQPADPQIQAEPRTDIKTFRNKEERVLDHYGWADKKAGTVHVPIDVAMERVAQSGLPAREPGKIPGPAPASGPNASSEVTGGSAPRGQVGEAPRPVDSNPPFGAPASAPNSAGLQPQPGQ